MKPGKLPTSFGFGHASTSLILAVLISLADAAPIAPRGNLSLSLGPKLTPNFHPSIPIPINTSVPHAVPGSKVTTLLTPLIPPEVASLQASNEKIKEKIVGDKHPSAAGTPLPVRRPPKKRSSYTPTPTHIEVLSPVAAADGKSKAELKAMELEAKQDSALADLLRQPRTQLYADLRDAERRARRAANSFVTAVQKTFVSYNVLQHVFGKVNETHADPSQPSKAFDRKRASTLSKLILTERLLLRYENAAFQTLRHFERVANLAQQSIIGINIVSELETLETFSHELGAQLTVDLVEAKDVEGALLSAAVDIEVEMRRRNVSTSHGIFSRLEVLREEVASDVDVVERKTTKEREQFKVKVEAAASTPKLPSSMPLPGTSESKDVKLRSFVVMSDSDGTTSDSNIVDASTVVLDENGNKFTLAHPSDGTRTYNNLGIWKDLTLVWMGAALAGISAHLFRLPVGHCMILFGFLVSQVGGLDLLKNVVTVHTIGHLGIQLLFFSIGAEFSPERLRRVQSTALGGCPLMLTAEVFIFTFITYSLGTPIWSALSIGLACCVSSTQVAYRNNMLDPGNPVTSLVSGMLAVEDSLLGIIVASIPLFGSAAVLLSLAQLSLQFLFVIVLCVAAALLVMPRFLSFIVAKKDDTLLSVTLISILFAVERTCDWMNCPPELGCFVAGLIIPYSSLDPADHDVIVQRLRIVTHLFMPFFYVGVGYQIFPSFYIGQLTVLLILTCFILAVKFMVTYVILKFFFFWPHPTAVLASVTLSPLAEFTFVLCSIARDHGLMTRETYFMMIAMTILTLIAVPMIYPLVLTVIQRGIRRSPSDVTTIKGQEMMPLRSPVEFRPGAMPSEASVEV